jgi:adenosylcobinamide-phosphate guanylyltransferase
MEAIVMAGGKGTRLASPDVEKPLVKFIGKPMIAHVIRALKRSKIDKITVAVSPFTLQTKKWAEYSKLSFIVTPGKGYVEDYIWAAKMLNITRPFLIITADIPMINKNLINKTIDSYALKGHGALAVYVPLSLYETVSVKPDLVLKIGDNKFVPAGLNVIDGKIIDNAQEETILLLTDMALVFNVNTLSDLDALYTHYNKSQNEKLIANNDLS